MTRDEYVAFYEKLADAIGALPLHAEVPDVCDAISVVLKEQNPLFDEGKFVERVLRDK